MAVGECMKCFKKQKHVNFVKICPFKEPNQLSLLMRLFTYLAGFTVAKQKLDSRIFHIDKFFKIIF
jgi:hypothetical protein